MGLLQAVCAVNMAWHVWLECVSGCMYTCIYVCVCVLFVEDNRQRQDRQTDRWVHLYIPCVRSGLGSANHRCCLGLCLSYCVYECVCMYVCMYVCVCVCVCVLGRRITDVVWGCV